MRRVARQLGFSLAVMMSIAAPYHAAADPEPLDLNKLKQPAFTQKQFKWDNNTAQNSLNKNFTGFDKTVQTKSAAAFFDKSAPMGNAKTIETPTVTMNKSYAVRSYPLPDNFTQFNTSSSIPLRASTFADKNVSGFNKQLEMPTYNGPEAPKIRQDLNTIDRALSKNDKKDGANPADSSSLPDRNLSIEEVRALLNHNMKPEGSTPTPPSLQLDPAKTKVETTPAKDS